MVTLVTGGVGFVGANLLKELVRAERQMALFLINHRTPRAHRSPH